MCSRVFILGETFSSGDSLLKVQSYLHVQTTLAPLLLVSCFDNLVCLLLMMCNGHEDNPCNLFGNLESGADIELIGKLNVRSQLSERIVETPCAGHFRIL